MTVTTHSGIEEFSRHELKPIPSVAFYVGRPGTSLESFVVTWTPGHLHVGGDLGNLTLTHFHAMKTLEDAVKWVADADYGYLIGKSGLQRSEFNAEGTLKLLSEIGDSHINDEMALIPRAEREKRLSRIYAHWMLIEELYGPVPGTHRNFRNTFSGINSRAKRKKLLDYAMKHKNACSVHEFGQALMNSEISDYTDILCFRYPQYTRIQITALQYWAKTMLSENRLDAMKAAEAVGSSGSESGSELEGPARRKTAP